MENLKVCRFCLMAIESHEGQLPKLIHYIDEPEDDEEPVVCDWCGEFFDELYELI